MRALYIYFDLRYHSFFLNGEEMSLKSFEMAMQNPCGGCKASCCTMLPLHDFQLGTLMDVDYARYILNFENIELALLQGQKWRIHYQMSCSHLTDKGCELHESGQKPMVCQDYNPYQCFYKLIFHDVEQPNYVRFNAARFEAFAKHIVFDSHRRIVQYPDITALLAELPPIDPIPEPNAPIPDFVSEVHSNKTINPSLTEAELRTNPCQSCEAWCCSRLLFPQPNPQWLSSIDHQRFLLGFPGVSLGFSSSGWTVIVQSRCRHLTSDIKGGKACALYGKEERPITCRQLNALGCSYRYRFDQKSPPDFIHINRHQFEKIALRYQYDTHGAITQAPQYSDIRSICQNS